MRFGFESWEEIEQYLGIDSLEEDEKKNKALYDFILIDIDSKEMLNEFKLIKEKNYFLTSFDMFSLNKGMRIFENLPMTIDLTKIIFTYEQATKEEEEYLDNVSLAYKINWSEYTLYFQILNEDNKVMQENQRLEKLRFKRLSPNYKDSLAYVIQDINKSINLGTIRKVMKE